MLAFQKALLLGIAPFLTPLILGTSALGLVLPAAQGLQTEVFQVHALDRDEDATSNGQKPSHLVRAEPHKPGQKELVASSNGDALVYDPSHELSTDEFIHTEVGADGEVTINPPKEELEKAMPSSTRPLTRRPSSDETARREHAQQTAVSLIEQDFNQSHIATSHLSFTQRAAGMVFLLIILIVLVWVALVFLLFTFKGSSSASESGITDDVHAGLNGRSQRNSAVSWHEQALNDVTDAAQGIISDVTNTMSLADMFGPDGYAPEDAAGGETFRDVYEVGNKLGDGTFGVVYEAFEIQTGNEMAVKMIDLAHSDYEDVMQELKMLRRVRHECLTVSCVDEYMDNCFYYMVMPKYTGGDLIESLSVYMEERGLLPEKLFMHCFEQMSASLDFVHSKKVVHRDIKPENFLTSHQDLADPENRVVLTDFGLSVVLKDGMPLLDDCSGTTMFWSPEMHKQLPFGFGCDVFALGLTAYMMLVGAHPFNTLVEMEEWVSKDGPIPIPPRASEPTHDMLELVLDRVPEERLTAAQLYALARSHPILSEKAAEVDASVPLQGIDVFKLCQSTSVVDFAQLQRREKMIRYLDKEHDVKEKGVSSKVVGGRGAVSFSLGPEEPHHQRLKSKLEESKTQLFAWQPFATDGLNKEKRHFDWWPTKKCQQENISGAQDGEKVCPRRASAIGTAPVRARPDDVAYLQCILNQNHVDWENLWQNSRETLEELARQCRSGETVLAEDDKKLIRVVDVVVPVLTSPSGDVLVMKDEKYGSKAMLPGKKRFAWENRNVTALRALAFAGFDKEHLDFTENREVIIQKKESKDFPGIETVYRRHVIRVELASAFTSDEHLTQKGWPKGEPLVRGGEEEVKMGHSKTGEELNGKKTMWSWITDQSFRQQELLEGDAILAARYSEVVPARTRIDRGAAALRDKLRRCSVDPDAIPAEKFERLAREEESGECTLVEQTTSDGKRTLKRVVKLTAVRVLSDNGAIMMEVGKEVRGKVTPNFRLPGIKQRLQENPFLAARRWLTSQLMVDDDEVHIDTSAGGLMEETGESTHFPGLASVYEKEIVQVRLANDVTLVAPPPLNKRKPSSPPPETERKVRLNSGFASDTEDTEKSEEEKSRTTPKEAKPCPGGCGFQFTDHESGYCCGRCGQQNGHGPTCEQKPMPKKFASKTYSSIQFSE